MERRLLQQAESSPTPPHALTERILRQAEKDDLARRSTTKRRFGAALLSWRIAGVAVAAVAAMVLGGQLLLNPARSPGDATDMAMSERSATVPSIQVAMATIANRDLLLEPSDAKLRSETGRSSTNTADARKAPEASERVVPRLYDIEVSSDLVSGWLAHAREGSPIPSAELEPLVGSLQAFNSSQNVAILFDEALQTRIPQPTPPGVAKQTSAVRLRVYDLRQQPADDLLRGISVKTTQRLAPGYLVTFRP
jgi:hypothetical protein